MGGLVQSGLSTRRRLGWLLPRFRHPSQVVVAAFAVAIAVGTAMLSLPVAKAGPGSATLLEALFTATSAVCVTGLVVVDTPTYWSAAGEAMIAGLIQMGGFGIMTMATLLVMAVTRRLGLRSRLHAAAETKSLGIGDIRSVVLGVASITLLVELTVAVVFTVRLITGYGVPIGQATWSGAFHAVSAFNNAGFSLYSDSLIGFAHDPWVTLPIAAAFICGGLGFPVLMELRRQLGQPRRWSLHTKMTLVMTAFLLVGGTAFVLASEWRNPATLEPLSTPAKLLNGFFTSATTRTAGFNTLDTADMTDGTWLGMAILMFIGGGSAGTAGGIKVTTIALLAVIVLAEIRGEKNVVIFDRQVLARAQRQALTVSMLAALAIVSASVLLLEISDHPLDRMLFEVVSAFATVGLSTGITDQLPAVGHVVIIMLMFIGRLGPITLASALALRERDRRYQLPEGRPIVG